MNASPLSFKLNKLLLGLKSRMVQFHESYRYKWDTKYKSYIHPIKILLHLHHNIKSTFADKKKKKKYKKRKTKRIRFSRVGKLPPIKDAQIFYWLSHFFDGIHYKNHSRTKDNHTIGQRRCWTAAATRNRASNTHFLKLSITPKLPHVFCLVSLD